MKKVVIRKVEDEWQIATVFAGLYNCIVGCGSFAAAVRYAEDELGCYWEKFNKNMTELC